MPLLRSLVMSSLVVVSCSALGCAAEIAQRKARLSVDAEAEKKESDSVLKVWIGDTRKCDEIKPDFFVGGDAPKKARACYDAADSKLFEALKSEAAAQDDAGAREAVNQALTCTGKATLIDATAFPGVQRRVPDDVKACIARKREALAKIGTTKRAESDEIATLEKKDSADAWLEFIEKHHDDKRVPKAAKQVLAIAARSPADVQASLDERLVHLYPAAIVDLPAQRRLLLVGPKGATIRDIQKMQNAKISQSIITARVKASTEPYKQFDADELVALKEMGFADETVAAMMEVTTKLEDRRRDAEERQAMRAELAALKKLIEEKKADGKSSGQIVQTKEGPMDVLASCAKRLGAVKLCDQLPFPASTVCSSSVESEFPCPNK